MDMNYGGGMWEGGGWAGWSGVGGEWDNCNSIINKYIKKKKNLVLDKAAFYLNLYPSLHFTPGKRKNQSL